MAKLLVITANPKPKELSSSLRMAEHFVRAYSDCHPEDEVLVLDLYKENIAPLTNDDLIAMREGTPSRAREHAEVFASYDKYVFVAPLWNFSVPGVMKCYLDYIVHTGVSFMYKEGKRVSLLAPGKKAVYITSQGGEFDRDRAIEDSLAFIGISDFSLLALHNTSRGTPDEKQQRFEQMLEKIQNFVHTF